MARSSIVVGVHGDVRKDGVQLVRFRAHPDPATAVGAFLLVLAGITVPEAHPLFEIVPGPVESWERPG